MRDLARSKWGPVTSRRLLLGLTVAASVACGDTPVAAPLHLVETTADAKVMPKRTITRSGKHIRIRLNERVKSAAGRETSGTVRGRAALNRLRDQLMRHAMQPRKAGDWRTQLRGADGSFRSLNAREFLALLADGGIVDGGPAAAVASGGVTPFGGSPANGAEAPSSLVSHLSASTVSYSGSAFEFSSWSNTVLQNGDLLNYPKVVDGGARTVSLPNGSPIYNASSCTEATPVRPGSCNVTVLGRNGGTVITGWPNVSTGEGCGFDGTLGSTSHLQWHKTLVPFVSSPQESEVGSAGSFSYRTPCFAPPTEGPCELAEYCEGGDAGGNPSGSGGTASTEGEIAFSTVNTGSPGTLVCFVKDWFAWTGSAWEYTDTEVLYCWRE